MYAYHRLYALLCQFEETSSFYLSFYLLELTFLKDITSYVSSSMGSSSLKNGVLINWWTEVSTAKSNFPVALLVGDSTAIRRVTDLVKKIK